MSGADEWIATVIAKADALRKAGVLGITVGGCSAQLAPAVVDLPLEQGDAEPEPDVDPLKNPALYADGKVPGFSPIADKDRL